MSGPERVERANIPTAEAPERVSVIDQALWKRFADARTPGEFGSYWLALQCRMLPDAVAGVVVLGPPDEGPFAPVAFWPAAGAGSDALSKAAETALGERRTVAQACGSNGATPERHALAYPLLVDGHLYGVVAVELETTGPQLRGLMRQLQWGLAWLETMVRRDREESDRRVRDRTTAVLDLVAVALEEPDFRGACNAVATTAAARLGFDRVSIGFLRGSSTTVAAFSHSAKFGKRMNLVHCIGAAMDEAIDQHTVLLYPRGKADDYQVCPAQAKLARDHDSAAVLTAPFGDADRAFGAFTFEGPAAARFDQEAVELCECIAAVTGPILENRRRVDRHIVLKAVDSGRRQVQRLFGPRYYGRKLAAVSAVAVAAVFYLAVDTHRVNAPATLQGEIRRSLVAPFDGYLLGEHARAGDKVRKDQVLAELDDSDLALEHLRWITTRRQRIAEYDRALASRNRADAKIVEAQMEQAAAQIELIGQQLKRARIRAPFDGHVVVGDLSQSIGSGVKRGDLLFEIAPLDAYRVTLAVAEDDVGEVAAGQKGSVLLASIPDEALPFTVTVVTPIAETRDGLHYFRVDARLDRVLARLRPGMEGVGKIDIGERRLIWIHTHKLWNWLEFQAWSWWR
jgi:hypothetical protein